MSEKLEVPRLELSQRIETLRQRESQLRLRVAQTQQKLKDTDRKLSAQQKIALGAALLRALEAKPQTCEQMRRFLIPHITRQTDIDALKSTILFRDVGNEAE
ncbi:hypothetical protein [Radicibacter daui]|uniref:hypothetical protein n=1 Tax=Radicibacter daui TaxID=3064829 RepID=UPI0040469037